MNEKYILVAHFSDRTSALVSKDCLKYMKFGKNNNFAESDVYEWLNTEYLKELEKEFGENSIKIHETNLLSHNFLIREIPEFMVFPAFFCF